MKDEKGITLLALAITIIILIIITSIAIYSGVSTIRYAKFNKAKSEIELLQSNVNFWNEEYNKLSTQDDKDDYINNIGETTTGIDTRFQTATSRTVAGTGVTDFSKYRFLTEGYIKDTLGLDGSFDFLVDIENRKVILFGGLSYNGKYYFTAEDFGLLNVNSEPIKDVDFKLTEDDRNIVIYELKFADIKGDIDINKFRVQYCLKTKASDPDSWLDVTNKVTKYTEKGSTKFKFPVTQEGRYSVKVTSTDKKVSNTEYIAINIRPNAPKLTTGMIPIKFNKASSKWVICEKSDEEWYNYDEDKKQWANVMLSDGSYDSTAQVGTEITEENLGSMFVWIPRYCYNISGENNNQKIDVSWCKGTSYNYSSKKEDNEGYIEEAGKTNPEYKLHPAFADGSTAGVNYSNGEWKKEIEGIWISKFQAGFATSDGDAKVVNKKVSIATEQEVFYPVFKGRKFAYNFLTATDCYNLSLALDDADSSENHNSNPYGITTAANNHLMKNSEWGAAAYLSISQYGYSEGTIGASTKKFKNNLSISDDSVENPNNEEAHIKAITGYTQEETGNVNNMTYSFPSDLKDTVRGTGGSSFAWNNVTTGSDKGAGTRSSTTGTIYGIYDMGGCLADYTASYIDMVNGANIAGISNSDCLVTVYPTTNTSNNFGDAISETQSWFGESSQIDTNNGVFFLRGGSWNSNPFGLCNLTSSEGNALENAGFHAVLIVE